MIRIENECVGCPPHLGCLGSVCPHRNSIHFYCDDCKDEFDTLYHYDGEELCIDCIESRLEKVSPYD